MPVLQLHDPGVSQKFFLQISDIYPFTKLILFHICKQMLNWKYEIDRFGITSRSLTYKSFH